MCAAQHVARLLLHCVDRKKQLLALGCHSFGPECGLVDLDCHGWPYVFGRKSPERVGYLTKPRRDMDSLVA